MKVTNNWNIPIIFAPVEHDCECPACRKRSLHIEISSQYREIVTVDPIDSKVDPIDSKLPEQKWLQVIGKIACKQCGFQQVYKSEQFGKRKKLSNRFLRQLRVR